MNTPRIWVIHSTPSRSPVTHTHSTPSHSPVSHTHSTPSHSPVSHTHICNYSVTTTTIVTIFKIHNFTITLPSFCQVLSFLMSWVCSAVIQNTSNIESVQHNYARSTKYLVLITVIVLSHYFYAFRPCQFQKKTIISFNIYLWRLLLFPVLIATLLLIAFDVSVLFVHKWLESVLALIVCTGLYWNIRSLDVCSNIFCSSNRIKSEAAIGITNSHC